MGPSGLPSSSSITGARLQELKRGYNLHPERQDDTLEDESIDLRNGEQAFMAVNQN